MSRSVLLIGNGLGMALEPKYFSLSCAMASVWSDPECLSKDQKALIASCVKSQGRGNHQPKSEDDLDILHLSVVAYDFLGDLKKGSVTWLTQHGICFPKVTRTYLSRVAWHFHNKYERFWCKSQSEGERGHARRCLSDCQHCLPGVWSSCFRRTECREVKLALLDLVNQLDSRDSHRGMVESFKP
jgi:hypothetical protein